MNKKAGLVIITTALMALVSCTQQAKNQTTNDNQRKSDMEAKGLETATFGAGCFWCVEAIFQRLDGVVSVTSGYAGGNVPNPTYEQVCSGKTGHAEVAQIVYDPSKISYDELLKAFWSTHDPTTLNRQGNDIGTQYRSAIFYHNDDQRALAEKYREELNKSKVWSSPVVTEIVPFKEFYKAENYHQDYYNNNKAQPYCMFVIAPKLEKFQKVFEKKLKRAE